MFPQFNLFGFEIYTYSVFAAVGFIVAAFVTVYLGKLRSLPSDKSLISMLVAVAGVFIGGHFLFALTNIKDIISLFAKGSFSFSSFMLLIGGMVFYGGLFGAMIALLIYTKVDKSLPRADVFDLFSVSAVLFHAFGRVGCFFAGCCYGIETEFGLVFYTNPASEHYGVSRFPVQLAEALGNLLIFFLLYNLFKRKKMQGKLLPLYLGIYAPLRFVLEFFRGDKVRGFIFGFSTSQVISLIVMLVLSVYFVFKLLRKGSDLR